MTMGIFKDYFKGYEKTKTTQKLTYDELYDIIKDGNFPCGQPELTGTGMMRCIQFPAVDKYRLQVAIMGNTITITKIYSGVKGALKEMALDAVTDNNYGLLNHESVDANRMTETVRSEIARLLDAKGLLAKK